MKNRLKSSNQAVRVIDRPGVGSGRLIERGRLLQRGNFRVFEAFLSWGKSSQRVVENRRKQQEIGCKQNNTRRQTPVHLFFCTHDSHSPTEVHRAPSHDLKDAPTPRSKPLVHRPANKSTPPRPTPLVCHTTIKPLHSHRRSRWYITRPRNASTTMTAGASLGY